MAQIRIKTASFVKQLRAATCNFTGLAVALLLILSVFMAPSANAHDVLISSNPEDGAEVDSLTSFTLTFSDDPLDVNPIIAISGPDGQEKALDVTPVIDGRDVYVEFSDLEPGTYEVSWRVVSSDGHPIEGEQSFTILPSADAEPGPDAGTPSEDELTEEAPPVDPDKTVISENEAPQDPSADESDSGTPGYVWVILAVAVLIIVVIIFATRKKPKSVNDAKTNDETAS